MADIGGGAKSFVTVGELTLADLASRVGVPFVILLIVLQQLSPKIDRGIEIADHVDAELQYLAAVGCSPSRTTSTPVPRLP